VRPCAMACVLALAAQLAGQRAGAAWGGAVYLATDGVPISRQEIVESCLGSAVYEGGGMPAFSATEGPLGRAVRSTPN
jgi:hypothetical protein